MVQKIPHYIGAAHYEIYVQMAFKQHWHCYVKFCMRLVCVCVGGGGGGGTSDQQY